MAFNVVDAYKTRTALHKAHYEKVIATKGGRDLVYGDDSKLNSCHWNFLQAFNKIPAVQAIENAQRRNEVVEWLSDRWDLNILQPNNYAKDELNNIRGFMRAAPPLPMGTGVEWYAEMDLYVIINNCPVGDQSAPMPEATCVHVHQRP